MSQTGRASGKFVKGVSGNPKGRPKLARQDGWSTVLSGVSTPRSPRDKLMLSDVTLPYQELYKRYRHDHLAARIVETYPKEAAHGGFCFEASHGDESATDIADQVHREWQRLCLIQKIRQARYYENAYGGSMLMVTPEDPDDILTPYDPTKRIGCLDVLEAREVSPTRYNFKNIRSVDNEVLWTVNGRNVHSSRLIPFRGIRVDNLVRLWYGDSVLLRVEQALKNYNVSWEAVIQLLNDFSQAVYKMKGLSDIVSANQAEALRIRMEAMEMAKAIGRSVMIDSDDEYTRQSTPISGLPEILDRCANIVAAAAEIPVMMLFTDPPGGLNSSGASKDQLQKYDRKVSEEAWENYCPRICKVTEMILANLKAPEDLKWEVYPESPAVEDDAQIAAREKTQAETDWGNIDRGVLTPNEVRKSRYGSGSYSAGIMLDPDPEPIDASALAEYQQIQAAPVAPMTPAPDVQRQSLNGAQVKSLLEIVTAANLQQISRESATAIVSAGFDLPADLIDKVVGPTFVAAELAPSLPFKKADEIAPIQPAQDVNVFTVIVDDRVPPSGSQLETLSDLMIAISKDEFERDIASSILTQVWGGSVVYWADVFIGAAKAKVDKQSLDGEATRQLITIVERNTKGEIDVATRNMLLGAAGVVL